MVETTNMSFHARALRAAPVALIVVTVAVGMIAWGFAPAAPHTVVRQSDRSMLTSPSGFQTVSMTDGGHTGLYYDAAEDLLRGEPHIDRVVLLGLGGGEMLKAAHRAQPKAQLTGIEIDKRTIELAKSEFGPWPTGTVLQRDDAIAWISSALTPPADVLMVDLYEDSKIVEASTRPEFFADCARSLRPNGIFLMNVWPAARASEIEPRLAPYFSVQHKLYGQNVVLVGLRRP